jgi:serine/threonine protein kinase
MYELISKYPVRFPDPEKHKITMSEDCKDLINKMLDKNPKTRIGTVGGVDEITNHPWFASINPKDLFDKKVFLI